MFKYREAYDILEEATRDIDDYRLRHALELIEELINGVDSLLQVIRGW